MVRANTEAGAQGVAVWLAALQGPLGASRLDSASPILMTFSIPPVMGSEAPGDQEPAIMQHVRP